MAHILFFKEVIIADANAEIIFHKEYTYIYNSEPFPIVKFTLINCKNFNLMDIQHIDPYNDGISIEIKLENGYTIFEATDASDITTKIICDKLLEEELESKKRFC